MNNAPRAVKRINDNPSYGCFPIEDKEEYVEQLKHILEIDFFVTRDGVAIPIIMLMYQA
jgi:hypothetical protein